jgi:hypothetical protein
MAKKAAPRDKKFFKANPVNGAKFTAGRITLAAAARDSSRM